LKCEAGTWEEGGGARDTFVAFQDYGQAQHETEQQCSRKDLDRVPQRQHMFELRVGRCSRPRSLESMVLRSGLISIFSQIEGTRMNLWKSNSSVAKRNFLDVIQ